MKSLFLIILFLVVFLHPIFGQVELRRCDYKIVSAKSIEGLEYKTIYKRSVVIAIKNEKLLCSKVVEEKDLLFVRRKYHRKYSEYKIVTCD